MRAESHTPIPGATAGERPEPDEPLLRRAALNRPAHYLPIAEHGVVGDLHTAALVGTDATIDWYCPGRFDGPSVFAALLDHRRGGFYRIAPPDSRAVTKQLYLPDTNVLITRFLSPDGVSEVQDFMPIGNGPQRLVRRVVGVRGSLPFRLELERPKRDSRCRSRPQAAPASATRSSAPPNRVKTRRRC